MHNAIVNERMYVGGWNGVGAQTIKVISLVLSGTEISDTYMYGYMFSLGFLGVLSASEEAPPY